jgi:hypothetical protein
MAGRILSGRVERGGAEVGQPPEGGTDGGGIGWHDFTVVRQAMSEIR